MKVWQLLVVLVAAVAIGVALKNWWLVYTASGCAFMFILTLLETWSRERPGYRFPKA